VYLRPNWVECIPRRSCAARNNRIWRPAELRPRSPISTPRTEQPLAPHPIAWRSAPVYPSWTLVSRIWRCLWCTPNVYLGYRPYLAGVSVYISGHNYATWTGDGLVSELTWPNKDRVRRQAIQCPGNSIGPFLLLRASPKAEVAIRVKQKTIKEACLDLLWLAGRPYLLGRSRFGAPSLGLEVKPALPWAAWSCSSPLRLSFISPVLTPATKHTMVFQEEVGA